MIPQGVDDPPDVTREALLDLVPKPYVVWEKAGLSEASEPDVEGRYAEVRLSRMR